MTKKRTRIILFVTLIFIILLAIPSYFGLRVISKS